MILVGLSCIQTNPLDRPPMSKVVDMLEGSLESLQIPPKAFFSLLQDHNMIFRAPVGSYFSPFEYASDTLSFTLFYGCPFIVSYHSGGSYCYYANDTRNSLYLTADSVGSIVPNQNTSQCHGAILIPVRPSSVHLSTDYILRNGFDVTYAGSYQSDCVNCTNSGGSCGYSGNSRWHTSDTNLSIFTVIQQSLIATATITFVLSFEDYIAENTEKAAQFRKDNRIVWGSLDKVLKWYRWIAVYPTLKKLVDDMSFEEFCSINVRNSDNRLIHVLVERWWPSTHTFTSLTGTGFHTVRLRHANGHIFWRGRELPYDERYSKLKKAEKKFPEITSSDISLDRLRYFGASGFDWGMPIMAALYWGLDEVSVLRDGKVKKSITEFYALLEFWFFEYCWVGMYLVKRYHRMEDITNIDWQPWHKSMQLIRPK
ncbi:hypothetical protein GIB67_023949, partial [Kingdonia uniflora]